VKVFARLFKSRLLPPARPGARTWEEFFALARTIDVPDDFMADRPMNQMPVERNLFGEDD
jgi:antitoxin VapB